MQFCLIYFKCILALSFQATQSEDLSCFFSAPSYTGYWFCFRVFILLVFSCSVLFLTVRPGQVQSPVALICGTRMQAQVLPHPAGFYLLQWSTQLQEQTGETGLSGIRPFASFHTFSHFKSFFSSFYSFFLTRSVMFKNRSRVFLKVLFYIEQNQLF